MYIDVFIKKDTDSLQLNGAIASLFVNPNSDLFKEHFEGYAITPGAFSLVFCIENVIHYLSELKNIAFKLTEILKIRFLHPIKPNTVIHLIIKSILPNEDKFMVSFAVENTEKNSCVDGLICLGIK